MLFINAFVIPALQKWSIVIIIVAIGMADPQIPMPYPVPYPSVVHIVQQQPPMAVPVPVPVPVGIPIPHLITEHTTTTTTTCKPKEEQNTGVQNAVKIIIPWPQFHFPPHINKPPVLPFTNDNFTLRFPPLVPPPPPVFPMPYPMPGPPIIMIPYPGIIQGHKPNPKHRKPGQKKRGSSKSSDTSTCSDSCDTTDSSSSDDSDSSKDYSKKSTKNKYAIYRSNKFKSLQDNNEIKPVLNYVSKNGEIKMQKALTMNQASKLLSKAHKTRRRMQVVTTDDEISAENKVMIMAHTAPKKVIEQPVLANSTIDSNKKVTTTNNSISNGRKVLTFNPPQDKKLTNITLTFDLGN